jgi:hypothetical protein
VLEPAVSVIVPPVAEDAPDESEIEPLGPAVLAPVLTVTLPDVPLFAVPVEKDRAPLTPEDPALAVPRTTPPLLVAAP